MNVETHHTTPPDQESQLSKDQQAWVDHHNSMWDALNEPYKPSNHDTSYTVGDYTFEPISKGEHPPIGGSLSLDEVDEYQPRTSIGGELTVEEIFDHNEQQEAKEKKGVKGALGAIATKIAKVFKPKTLSGELSDTQTVGQGEQSWEQPRITLVDIKAKALELATKTKDMAVGFALLATAEGMMGLASAANRAAEATKNATGKLSDHFTDPAPTVSNPENRELNTRGKVLIFGLGIAASTAALLLGTTLRGGEHAQQATEAANQFNGMDTPDTQLPLDLSDNSVAPDVAPTPPSTPDQLPVESVTPETSTPAPVPEGIDTTTVEPPVGEDLKVDFSPQIGTLEAGDNIWDDTMQMLKEGGFDGPQNELVDRTNILTEWRLKEMGITPEQAKYLPVGTKLPMPDFSTIQELITKVEQLKR